ncbi:MAG: surface-adhesin E family protein [Pseudomonadota bacterium]
MTKNRTAVLSIFCAVLAFVSTGTSNAGESEWQVYSQEANGDTYFFNMSRVQSTGNSHAVWKRVRYGRSVMGASSYQSHLEIDCSEQTERVLQQTFFSDEHWERPAMSTDHTKKPKRLIAKGSASARLAEILCGK